MKDPHNTLIILIGAVGLVAVFYIEQFCVDCKEINDFWKYLFISMMLLGKGAIEVVKNMILGGFQPPTKETPKKKPKT